MTEFKEKSNLVQTLITAAISIVVGAVGWGFIKNWMNKKNEGSEPAPSRPAVQAAPPPRDATPSVSAVSKDVFSDAMTMADAKKLANDSTKIPDDTARAQVQLILKHVEETDPKREKLGVLHDFSVGNALEQVRKGGDAKRYTFLNLATISQLDVVSTTQDAAKKYFPNIGETEYKALRAFVDVAKTSKDSVIPLDKPFPDPMLAALLKNMKKDRLIDIENQRAKLTSSLFPNAADLVAQAHLSPQLSAPESVRGVEPPSGVTAPVDEARRTTSATAK